jgi:hypothetical protein
MILAICLLAFFTPSLAYTLCTAARKIPRRPPAPQVGRWIAWCPWTLDPSLAANEPEYNEAECFVFEHALQLGFEMVDDDGDVLACTLGQLLALLRARGGAV